VTQIQSPIHWECYVVKPGVPEGTANVVDLRTLPEEVKVAIIQAAINVGFRFGNGQFDDLQENSEEEDALAELASAVDEIRPHMHSVNLIPSV